MTKKTLYILRHAKAETHSAEREDHERRLTPRGVENARHMGEHMARQGIRPDKVLCSTAARTQETWEELQSGAKCQMLDKLYLASANAMLTMLADIPESTHSLMLIGHNPGVHELCLKLSRDGDHALLSKLAVKFPTCTLATIALGSVKWHDIGHARGTLTGLITPKML